MILTSLTAKQKAVWQSLEDSRITVCDGSVRSGKSVGADVAWIDFVRHAPNGNLLMVGKTERTLKRNVIDPLFEILGSSRCRYVGGSGELFICGRRVYLVGANDERAEEKIRGLTLIGAYVDEISTIPESFWTMLLSRLSLEGARLLGTTNPDAPSHWLKVNYLDKSVELGLARFQFKLTDNPHLPASYVEAIKKEFTGLWRRRLIDGEWCVASGAVYDMWNPERHVVAANSMPAIRRLVAVGMDYGFTNPTAGLLIGITNEQRPRLAVVDEWSPPPMTDVELSAAFRQWLAGRQVEWVCVDPSAASLQQQLFNDGISNVVGANNAVVPGIRLVSSLLGTDRMVISDKCVELAKEVPSYVWDSKQTAKGHDAPLKINDHFCDALRYGLMSTYMAWHNEVPLAVPVDLEDVA